MSAATNQLVNEVKKMARKPLSVGAGAVLTAALAVSLVFHESARQSGRRGMWCSGGPCAPVRYLSSKSP
jgi:hypothetical protein